MADHRQRQDIPPEDRPARHAAAHGRGGGEGFPRAAGASHARPAQGGVQGGSLHARQQVSAGQVRPNAQRRPSPERRQGQTSVPHPQGAPAARPQGTPAARPQASYGAVRPVPTGTARHAGAPASGAYAARTGAAGPRGPRDPRSPQGRTPQMPGAGRAPKKGGPWRVVFWVALVVFVLAIAALGAIAFSYWQGQHAYDTLAEEAFDAPSDVEGTSLADLTVDWDALRAINPDVVGWIYIPDTIVNYPIMYSGDDETYLTRDFYGNEGGWWMADYGAVFLSGYNTPDFSDTNSIVYGHNLLNGSMFADVAKFADNGQFNSHRTVYLLTPQGNYRLTSFAVVNVFADDPLVQTSFASEQDYAAYVQDKIDRSIVTPDEGMPDAASITQTFAFSTCDHDHYEDKRYVLFCSVAEYAPVGSGGGEGAGAIVGEGAGVVDPEAADAIEDASGDVA